jgi:hypothetical protein
MGIAILRVFNRNILRLRSHEVKILEQPELPEELFEIHIKRKYSIHKNDRRSYYSEVANTIMVTETTLDEIYSVVIEALKKKAD